LRGGSSATCASACSPGASRITKPAQLVNLGVVDYREAWELQRAVAADVAGGARPDTVLLLEHPPTVTLGRRTEDGELHIPDDAEVDVVEVDRGGKSTYHAPGQLVCYPILDLTRHGQDVKKYCRDLEEALIRTTAAFGVGSTRIEGLTGIWLQSPPRKIASIGIHLTRWVSTHGYALNVNLDAAPFTEWITACGLDGYMFTTMAAELGREVTVDDVRPAAAQALADVFGFVFDELSADEAGRRAAAGLVAP
jgi:lipoyl(octanoyl) transferase